VNCSKQRVSYTIKQALVVIRAVKTLSWKILIDIKTFTFKENIEQNL